MKKLSPQQTKFLKIIHILFATMWLGGCLALTIFPYFIQPVSVEEAKIYTRIIDFIDIWLIIVGGVGSFVTGLIYSIWTNWGFFKHRWLLVKWIIVVLQTLYGTFVLGLWWLAKMKEIAETMTGNLADYPDFFKYLHLHTGGALVQLVFLLFLLYISVVKPWKKKG